MKYLAYLLLPFVIAISSCCAVEFEFDPDACVDQVFLETKVVKLENTYTVNTSSQFLEASTISGSSIRNALQIEGDNFEIKSIELTSAQIQYKRNANNTSAALIINTAVTGNTFNQLLLQKENLFLPLVDIPGTGFTDPVNINEFLNGPAIKELRNILLNYATVLNDEGISFILTGQGSPAGTLAHFDLNYILHLSIVYEICRYAPIGTGQRVCE